MKIKKNFTIIPNELLKPSQLSNMARLLFCVLLRYCGQDDWCFPSQEKLASDLGVSSRHIRTILDELIASGVILKKRRGFNRSNNYKVAKQFVIERNSSSYQLGSKFPLHDGNTVPPKSTYIKGKGKRSKKGLESLRKIVESQIRQKYS